MSLFSRIAGVVESFFQVGGPSGPAWKNNSGNIDARNASDAAFVNVRGLDPVIADDLVTKRYADASSRQNFSAHVGTTFNLGPGGSGSTTLVCDTVDFDSKTNYTAGSGTFTAQAAGYYQFTAIVRITGLSLTDEPTIALKLAATGGSIKGAAVGVEQDPENVGGAMVCAVVTGVIKMAATDTLNVDILWQGFTAAQAVDQVTTLMQGFFISSSP